MIQSPREALVAQGHQAAAGPDVIQLFGHGVAMPTAPDAVKAVAQYVAPPVTEEGAAQMIERIALDGWRGERPRGEAPARDRGERPRGERPPERR